MTGDRSEIDQLQRAAATLRDADLARRHGRVSNLIGLVIEATGLEVEIGEVCMVGIERATGALPGGRAPMPPVPAEVVGFRAGRTLLMPLGELQGIGPGTKVLGTGAPFRVPVGSGLLGRVIDGLGAPLDDREPPTQTTPLDDRAPERTLRRPRISERVGLGCAPGRPGPRGPANGSASSPYPAWASPRCWA